MAAFGMANEKNAQGVVRRAARAVGFVTWGHRPCITPRAAQLRAGGQSAQEGITHHHCKAYRTQENHFRYHRDRTTGGTKQAVVGSM